MNFFLLRNTNKRCLLQQYPDLIAGGFSYTPFFYCFIVYITEVLKLNQFLKFAFIGGDLRQIRVIKKFVDDGIEVRVTGTENYDFLDYNSKIKKYSDTDYCIEGADIVVLPVPYNDGDGIIKTPFSNNEIHINDVLRKMNSSQILFAGKSDERLDALAKLYNIHLIDYLNREEMSVLNSIPTVEGAIKIAISETAYTLHGSKCLVMGYGRIGKLLSHSLKALGADVYVSARKYSDLAWIKAYGYKCVPFRDFDKNIDTYNIIFNTIPVNVLDFKVLPKISDSCLIIDLASKPGGVDFETAGKLGKNVIWALSLPGKVAPDTAGDILKDTIINILDELGV